MSFVSEKNCTHQWNPNNFPLMDALFGEIHNEEDPFSWWKKEQEKQTSRTFENNEMKIPEWDKFQEIEFKDCNNTYFPIQFTQPTHPFTFSESPAQMISPKSIPNQFPRHRLEYAENKLSDFMNSLSFANSGKIQKGNKKKSQENTKSKRKENQFFPLQMEIKAI